MEQRELLMTKEKCEIPSFVGMRMNSTDYKRAHSPKGVISMFPSVLATMFRIPMDNYKRAILT